MNFAAHGSGTNILLLLNDAHSHVPISDATPINPLSSFKLRRLDDDVPIALRRGSSSRRSINADMYASIEAEDETSMFAVQNEEPASQEDFSRRRSGHSHVCTTLLVKDVSQSYVILYGGASSSFLRLWRNSCRLFLDTGGQDYFLWFGFLNPSRIT